MLNRWAGNSSANSLPTANLEALFYADTGVTTASGVSSVWADQSGLGHNFLQGTGANQPIYLPYSGEKYSYHPGIVGDNFSTPSSSSANLSNNADIVVDCYDAQWGAATYRALLGKESSADRDWSLVLVNGQITLYIFDTSGSFKLFATNDIGGGTSRRWYRARLTWVTGGVSSCSFYKSTDGNTWVFVQTVTLSTPLAQRNGSVNLLVGQRGYAGSELPFSGYIYRAKIYNGFLDAGGTVVVDFDPASYSTGSSWVSTTGETWTINNAASAPTPAQIVDKASLLLNGSSHFMQTAAFTLNQPATVYLVGAQITWTLNHELLDGIGGRMAIYQSPTSGKEALYAGSAGPSVANDVATPPSYSVLTSVFNGASSSISRNDGTAVTGDAGAGNPGGLTLGALAGGTANGNFQILALVAYSAAHDSATQTRVYNFLKAKYGL